ncbi:hypothetical protein HYN43_007200 [Mucilaginibacter celer]|uniref:Uncharacterized protein n=1 Tax=Mucilaginibacter celer TaxID=2305508 RepID=A0A494VUJ8_9SPHI|nr:hypothetical protein HYN43_007200 [Mucilaginibacter celer]
MILEVYNRALIAALRKYPYQTWIATTNQYFDTTNVSANPYEKKAISLLQLMLKKAPQSSFQHNKTNSKSRN